VALVSPRQHYDALLPLQGQLVADERLLALALGQRDLQLAMYCLKFLLAVAFAVHLLYHLVQVEEVSICLELDNFPVIPFRPGLLELFDKGASAIRWHTQSRMNEQALLIKFLLLHLIREEKLFDALLPELALLQHRRMQ